ncbi:protein of unassigned function [Methylobacterium oryzae CBMB20]|uniref:Protein of unassigned function n=1 Tax=Methylobacterium oryzae CBMB20 TaxID=693986 RepID=A0A089NQB7_9HYPH|nr:protein of unassigned function [Methylobacterium oryzae CBMB20]
MGHAVSGLGSEETEGRDFGVTIVHNTDSPPWRCWLSPELRCLVPFMSFSENEKARIRPCGSRSPRIDL